AGKVEGVLHGVRLLPVLYVSLLPSARSAPRFEHHSDRPDNQTRTAMGAERPWEKSYPPGVRWDAQLATTTQPARFDDSIDAWANKPALEYRDRKTSYGELGARVEALASGLMDLGVSGGKAVALYLPNTPYHPLAFFAALKAGGRIVHLSPLDAE